MTEPCRYPETKYANKIIFGYRGIPSGNISSPIIELIESKLEKVEENKSYRKKIFMVLVEMIQNAYYRSGETKSLLFPQVVLYLIRETDGYIVMTGNCMSESESGPLKERIGAYLFLTEDEQKKVYTERLGDGKFSSAGGAGLGLMEIIRRSEGHFNFTFFPCDSPGNIYFCIEVKIFK